MLHTAGILQNIKLEASIARSTGQVLLLNQQFKQE